MIEIADHEFRELITYVKNNYGINLSKKKNLIEGRLSNLLLEKGFTVDDVARIDAPIGIDINAKGAKEIALSIMGAVIKVKNTYQ